MVKASPIRTVPKWLEKRKSSPMNPSLPMPMYTHTTSAN